MNTQQKIIELNKVAEEVRAYKGIDIAKLATNAVPGEGDPDAQIMYIGEGPGAREDLSGRPFVGQAGKLLEKALKEVLGMDRSQVYITNIVKYRPPDNRDPFDNEIEACRNWLDRQIQIIEPKIIVTLGRFSMAKFIPGVTISKVHGQSRFIDFNGSKYIVFPMYHPAAALRAGEMMKAFLADFAKLKTLLSPAVSNPEEKKETNESISSQPTLF